MDMEAMVEKVAEALEAKGVQYFSTDVSLTESLLDYDVYFPDHGTMISGYSYLECDGGELGIFFINSVGDWDDIIRSIDDYLTDHVQGIASMVGVSNSDYLDEWKTVKQNRDYHGIFHFMTDVNAYGGLFSDDYGHNIHDFVSYVDSVWDLGLLNVKKGI